MRTIPAPRWWSVLLIAVAIPGLGFWLGHHNVMARNAEAVQALGVDMAAACDVNKVVGDDRFSRLCSGFATNVFLRNLSAATGALGLLLVLGSATLAGWAASNRDRNARVFPVLVPVSLFAIGILTLLQVSTAVVGLYAIGLVNLYTVVFVIAGLLAAIGLFRSLRTLYRRPSISEVSVMIPHADDSRIWRLVHQVATQVGAKAPENVIVGLQPNFYATSAEVRLPGRREALQGETIYLSLPMLRLFEEDELRAVIGHELGHFTGNDVTYTKRFAPLYRTLAIGLWGLNSLGNHWLHRLARLPAVEFTSFLLSLFAINERRISRDREFEADKVGAAASSPEGLASALVKLGHVAGRWRDLREAVARDSRIEPVSNVSDRLAAKARIACAYPIANAATSSSYDPAAHPTDTHPSNADRLAALGVRQEDLHTGFSDEGWAVHAGAQSELEALEIHVTHLEAYFQTMKAMAAG